LLAAEFCKINNTDKQAIMSVTCGVHYKPFKSLITVYFFGDMALPHCQFKVFKRSSKTFPFSSRSDFYRKMNSLLFTICLLAIVTITASGKVDLYNKVIFHFTQSFPALESKDVEKGSEQITKVNIHFSSREIRDILSCFISTCLNDLLT
jgi:hypothetical protein